MIQLNMTQFADLEANWRTLNNIKDIINVKIGCLIIHEGVDQDDLRDVLVRIGEWQDNFAMLTPTTLLDYDDQLMELDDSGKEVIALMEDILTLMRHGRFVVELQPEMPFIRKPFASLSRAC